MSSNNGNTPIAGFCDHSSTEVVILPKNDPEANPGNNYSVLACRKCGHALSFLPNPANQERWTRNAIKMAKLRILVGNRPSEIKLLNSLSKLGLMLDGLAYRGKLKLATKQQAGFEELVYERLGDIACQIASGDKLSPEQMAAYNELVTMLPPEQAASHRQLVEDFKNGEAK